MKVVIVGAGPAGVSVVETVRASNRQIELVMLSAEPFLPYSPPAMADHFLTGSGLHLWRGADWLERMAVDYRSGVEVTAVEPRNHRVKTADGAWLSYDKLVVASGSRLHAPLEGVDLPGIYNFKSLSAAEALVERVKSGTARKAIIVGAGFIGMEIALLLRALGVAVTELEMQEQVMPAMLDAQTAAVALDLMRGQSIDVRLDTEAVAFTGNGRAEGVALASGEVLTADILIAATGVRPNLDFLAGSGLSYRWGVTVDDFLQTSDPDVYAAGDVIEAPDLLTGEPYVHAIFPNAVNQGKVVGRNLLGYQEAYDGAERMNSLKHLGLQIVAAGLKEGDEVLNVGHDGFLRTLYLRDNRLVGFQLAGDIRAAGVLHSLMTHGRDVGHLKDYLLKPAFGQGTMSWAAMSKQAGVF